MFDGTQLFGAELIKAQELIIIATILDTLYQKQSYELAVTYAEDFRRIGLDQQNGLFFCYVPPT